MNPNIAIVSLAFDDPLFPYWVSGLQQLGVQPENVFIISTGKAAPRLKDHLLAAAFPANVIDPGINVLLDAPRCVESLSRLIGYLSGMYESVLVLFADEFLVSLNKNDCSIAALQATLKAQQTPVNLPTFWMMQDALNWLPSEDSDVAIGSHHADALLAKCMGGCFPKSAQHQRIYGGGLQLRTEVSSFLLRGGEDRKLLLPGWAVYSVRRALFAKMIERQRRFNHTPWSDNAPLWRRDHTIQQVMLLAKDIYLDENGRKFELAGLPCSFGYRFDDHVPDRIKKADQSTAESSPR